MPDVVPPGQEARMISPTLKGRDIFEKKDIRNAITGSTMIWEVRPMSKGLGYINRFLKLAGVKDNPTPIIIKASIMLNSISMNEYEEGAIIYN